MKSHHLPFISLALLLLLVTAGCNTQAASSSDPLFIKCWSHAFEEDGQDGVQNFRPCATHTFPAARYRNTFVLKENRQAEYSVLAANDAHSTENGKWAYDAKTKKLKIGNTEYEVLEIKEDLLKLKQ